MHTPGISIVIPVYNKWELTEACLRSLRAHVPHAAFEVIVVDNASADATAHSLAPLGEALFPGAFTRIRNTVNRNFAAACNQGAQIARYPLLFFLNNDTLLTPEWDTPLTRALANDTALAAVGPLLLFANGTVQHLGAAVYPDRSIRHFYTGIPASHPLARKRRSLAFITAAALLVHTEVFFAAGAFHEDYANGLEDVELCYRLRQMGRSLSVVPEATVYHLEGQTRNEDTGPSRNAALLRARCPDLRRPELHHIARADGYEPSFGLFFETLLAPDPARIPPRAVSETMADEARLRERLAKEIYWREGYLALAKLHERAGKPEQALETLHECLHHYPTLDVLEAAKGLAARTGMAARAEEYARLVDTARKTLRDPHFFRVRHDLIAQTAAEANDTLLAAMLAAWRDRYGKTAPGNWAEKGRD